MAVAAIAAFSTSCVEEKEACEKNNTGEITVVNTANQKIVVDVLYNSTDNVNEERILEEGASTIYTIPVGTGSIFAKTETAEWGDEVAVKTVIQCETTSYSVTPRDVYRLPCVTNNTGDITVMNTTDYRIVVDVKHNTNTNEERILEEGASTTYTIPVGAGLIFAKTETAEWGDAVAVKTVIQCGTTSYSVTNADIVVLPCVTNNTGEITITNDNPFEIMVDVVNSEHPYATEIRTLTPSASTTYTVTAGLTNTIQVKPEGWTWTNVDTRTAIQCETVSYSWALCNYDGNSYAKEVKVINNTGYKSVVDIKDYNSWVGEIALEDGETAYYWNCDAGEIYFWHRYYGESNVSTTDLYNVAECAEFTFTWTAGKVAAGKKSNEVKKSTPYVPFESLGTSSIKK